MSNDRGSATIWAVSAIAALVTLTVVVLALGAAVSTRHRAEAAADLAALAVASHALEGVDSACARAHVVTDGMGARLVRCELDGWDAIVEVDASSPMALSGLSSGHGRARAGPVPP